MAQSGPGNRQLDRVAVEVIWRDGQFAVDMVFSPSDAQDMGVAIGDVVRAIDGVESTELDLAQVKDSLRGNPGENRHLTLDRQGQTIEVDVLVEDPLPGQ